MPKHVAHVYLSQLQQIPHYQGNLLYKREYQLSQDCLVLIYLAHYGFKESDVKEVAKIIIEVLDNPEDAGVLAQAKERVKGLIQRYPIK